MALGNNITTSNRQAVNNAITAAERPYKVYSAILNQTGTASAVATVFENTLGGELTWSHYGTGIHKVEGTGLLTETKRIVFVAPASNLGNPVEFLGYDDEGTSDDYYMLLCKDDANAAQNGLVNLGIEIRIYN